jgi:hypothetical protein
MNIFLTRGTRSRPCHVAVADGVGMSIEQATLRKNISESFHRFDDGGKGWLGSGDLKCAVASLVGYKPSKVRRCWLTGDTLHLDNTARAELRSCCWWRSCDRLSWRRFYGLCRRGL